MKEKIKTIIIIVLLIVIVSMFNTKINWNYNGKMWSYKLGHFYLEKIGLRHE